MTFDSNIVLLGYNAWCIQESPIVRKEGVTVFYLSETGVNEPGKKGNFPVKKSFDIELVNKLKDVDYPCLAKAKMSLVVKANQTADIQLVDFTPVKPLDLFESDKKW